MSGQNEIHMFITHMVVEGRKDAACTKAYIFGIVVHFLPESTARVAESINGYSDEQIGFWSYSWKSAARLTHNNNAIYRSRLEICVPYIRTLRWYTFRNGGSCYYAVCLKI